MQRTGIRYLDFDLLIDRSSDGYEARVIDSPAGQAKHAFGSLSEVEAERMNTFRAIVSGHRAGKRRIDSPDVHAAKEVGGSLFRRVFDGPVGECWRTCLDRIRAEPNTGLRVRLRMGSAPELAELPWEFLYDAVENQFLSLSVQTPLVRYLDVRRPVQPLGVKPPLRVLVMISNPVDIDDLDIEEEWRQLREAVGELESRGLVAFDRLDRATLENLQRQLRREEYHIFHYIGHAGFDDTKDDGLLVLENEKGRSHLVRAEQLGNILHDEDSLRLAVLNACEGARSSRRDPFSGLAQSLVQKGIPAVIAMQYEISDDAAITLSHEFYRALGEGYPADAALGEARKMISNSNELEWGTPVLFLRSPDGALFDVREADEESRRSGQVHRLVRDARTALAGERWAEAGETAEQALALDPSHVEAAGIAAQAKRSHEVLRLYREGCEAQAAGRWQDALTRFQDVRTRAGNFRDVDALIDRARTEMRRAEKEADVERSHAADEERLRREREEAREREERIIAGLHSVAGGKAAAAKRRLPGCTVALTVSFAALAGLIGLSQIRAGVDSYPQPGGENAAAVGGDPEPEPPSGGTSQPSIVAPPPAYTPEARPDAVNDRVQRIRTEVREAVERASEAEAQALRTGDPSGLYASYGGAALESLLVTMTQLAGAGMHQDATLLDREVRSVDFDPVAGTATIDMVETWSTEFHQNGTDVCLGRIARHPIPQRLTLSSRSGPWLIVAIESNAQPVEPVPCY